MKNRKYFKGWKESRPKQKTNNTIKGLLIIAIALIIVKLIVLHLYLIRMGELL